MQTLLARFEPDYFIGSEDDNDDFYSDHLENCPHIGIVSISETECQCMDCLRVWPKEPNFKSDWPEFDRG